MRILIAEQDVALGLFLKKGLSVEGHEVCWLDDASKALDLIHREQPDLMVLDVSLDGGVDLLLTVHRRHHRTAVLGLLRQNTAEDRVQCLDMGADDCMAKPFSFHELTARCRALLRRQARLGEIVLTHGSLRLNRITRVVSVLNRPMSLTTKEFRLLEFLLQNAGRCCSRGELLQEVFDLPTNNATNVVDVYINYLRKKLGSIEESPLIETVRGSGYRLASAEGVESLPMRAEVETMHVSA